MTYRLVYTHRAARDVAALDPKTKERIGAQLVRYKEDPLRHAERLVHASLGSFRFRIGDYRVVFDLDGRGNRRPLSWAPAGDLSTVMSTWEQREDRGHLPHGTSGSNVSGASRTMDSEYVH